MKRGDFDLYCSPDHCDCLWSSVGESQNPNSVCFNHLHLHCGEKPKAKSGHVSNENDPMPKPVVNSSAEPEPLALVASSGTCFVNAFVQAAVVLVPVVVVLMRTVGGDTHYQFIDI
uniref:OTU domain-containing protein n=1 Tax=Globodera pallida TaxID=36090 RepID=A0A183C733_GLOPA